MVKPQIPGYPSLSNKGSKRNLHTNNRAQTVLSQSNNNNVNSQKMIRNKINYSNNQRGTQSQQREIYNRVTRFNLNEEEQ
jgi:hypothetical protein